MNLPAPYAWLAKEPAPKMLIEALKLYGIHETPGAVSNPVIIGWAKECGLQKVYTADSVAWCGLFMDLVALRAGKPRVKDPLWALNWLKWGEDGGQPELGDVLVFVREGGGHVGIYVGEDKDYYHVLGGNTSDAVSIARILKLRLKGVRQFFGTGKPANVRPVVLSNTGAPVTTNEA